MWPFACLLLAGGRVCALCCREQVCHGAAARGEPPLPSVIEGWHQPSPAGLLRVVGLDSGIKKEDFKRKKLNLVILLDVSGR